MVYASSEDASAARTRAESLGLSCSGPGGRSNADLSLVMANGVLSLRDNRDRRLKPLWADFEGSESPSKKQPLGRAVGRRTRTVIDATAGWGDDSRRLCAMGYRVTAVERNPIMAALLRDAVSRARHSGRSGVPESVLSTDAIDFLARHPKRWDCVYLDPMFPPKPRASTLPRRAMRLLRELAGDDPDKHRLFEAARASAGKRVVVKRPDHGLPAFGRPCETVPGKLVCYDVYHVGPADG